MAIQGDLIARYAAENGYRIVRTFADHGRSGLTLAGRPGLQNLLRTVVSGSADFEVILVNDVSRWGRFQDTDEAAHYEYICRDAGIAVHYCAEPFDNDGSLDADIMKTLKRSIAADHSRHLSDMIFSSQCRAIVSGFWPRGAAPYGFRRMLVDAHGRPKCILEAGVHKSIPSDRVVLVWGPDEEVCSVKCIYALSAQGMSPSAIAVWLNGRGLRSHRGGVWDHERVRGILENQIYLGRFVYNRTSSRLGQPRRHNPREAWVVVEHFTRPIVSGLCIVEAQPARMGSYRRWTEAEMIDSLAHLLKVKGYLSDQLIAGSPDVPSPVTCKRRFGSLAGLYRALDYVPHDSLRGALQSRIRAEAKPSIERVMAAITQAGGMVVRQGDSPLLRVDDDIRLVFRSTGHPTKAGGPDWRVSMRRTAMADAILIELHDGGEPIYYLLPRSAIRPTEPLHMGGRGRKKMERFRLSGLGQLYRRTRQLTKRKRRIRRRTA